VLAEVCTQERVSGLLHHPTPPPPPPCLTLGAVGAVLGAGVPAARLSVGAAVAIAHCTLQGTRQHQHQPSREGEYASNRPGAKPPSKPSCEPKLKQANAGTPTSVSTTECTVQCLCTAPNPFRAAHPWQLGSRSGCRQSRGRCLVSGGGWVGNGGTPCGCKGRWGRGQGTQGRDGSNCKLSARFPPVVPLVLPRCLSAGAELLVGCQTPLAPLRRHHLHPWHAAASPWHLAREQPIRHLHQQGAQAHHRSTWCRCRTPCLHAQGGGPAAARCAVKRGVVHVPCTHAV
jgi:hypothetical protein